MSKASVFCRKSRNQAISHLSSPHHHNHSHNQRQSNQQIKLTSRIKSVNVDTQIHGLLRAYPVLDLLDNAIDANLVDFACLDNLKAAVAVIFVVGRARQRGPDAGVDVGVVGEQAFLCGVEEVGAVVYAGLFRGGAAEDFGTPCVACRC